MQRLSFHSDGSLNAVLTAAWMALSAGLLGCGTAPVPAGSPTYTGPAPVFSSDTKGGDTGTSLDGLATDAAGEVTAVADGAEWDSLADAALDADLDAKGDTAGTDAAVQDAKADTKSDAKTDAAADTNSDALADAVDAGLDVADAQGPVCGNKTCDATETCKTCPIDCGACAAVCGDGSCSIASENCQTCSQDCGNCPVLCGDSICDATETCGSCPADCPCPKCGDGKCDAATENCQSCPGDCGACPGQCSPLTSTGCTGGKQCYPVATPPVCSAPGAIALGKPCNALADCAFGMLCISGVCGKVCDTSGTTPGYLCTKPAECAGLQIGGKPVAFNVGVCIGGDTCNLVTNSGCSSGLSCSAFNEGKACIVPGLGATNAPCVSSDDCLATHLCVTDSLNKKTCSQKCNAVTKLPACGTGLVCSGLSMGTPPKSAPDNLGACLK